MNILTELRMSLNPVRISFRPSGLVRMVSFLAISMYFSWANYLVFRLQYRPYLLSTKLRLKNCVLRWPSIGIVSTDSVSGCLVSVPGSWLNNQFVVCKFLNAIFRVSCCMLASYKSVFLRFTLSWLYISLLTLTAFRSLQLSGRFRQLIFTSSSSTFSLVASSSSNDSAWFCSSGFWSATLFRSVRAFRSSPSRLSFA